MSEIALNPFSYGILRLACVRLEASWAPGAWLSELRTLDHEIEYESRLECTGREVYVLFIEGKYFLGRSVLGDPFSLSTEYPVFDIEIASTFPADYPRIKAQELKQHGFALCPLPSDGLFLNELPSFYALGTGTLALVNS